MPYFIKCGDKVRGMISHELIMEFAERKKLRKSDWISVSKDGLSQNLQLHWSLLNIQTKTGKPSFYRAYETTSAKRRFE